MAIKDTRDYEDETIAVFGEELFEVCVLTSIGSVRRDPKSKLAPDEAAYLLIAQHARTLPDDGHAEYRFPGHAQGMTTLVTVQNQNDSHLV